ncbi:MAG: putative glycoside hydrolase [Firmicutes bacterium]|nr:putative glycoside hydrolase [Bacillota bacterium]
MKRHQWAVKIIFAVLILGVAIFSGCLPKTLSRPEQPPATALEQTEEEPQEVDPEEERKRRELEARLEEQRRLEARKRREEELKAELGPFFVELPPLENAPNPAVKAKGIYLTGHTAANPKRLQELLTLVDETELNAMVIDVKNDHGLMTYYSEIEIVKEVNANKGVVIKDIDALMAKLKEHDVYPIARIVVFRDPHLPEVRQEWAIQRRGGGLWRDRSGFAWVNPYDKNVWDYNIAIAKEAALKGFREIQFDYVRFPENAKRVDREAEFPHAQGRAKDEVIQEFLAYAKAQLEEYNVHVSADVFGVIATARNDADGIGQTWEKISPVVDIICPMVYPSHYGPGYFGYKVPDANPDGVINRALTDAIKRNAVLAEPAVIRPWLQSFTATWVKGHIPYGPKEVRRQIEAALALGIDEFLIWNPGNRYFQDAFLSETEAAALQREKEAARQANELDLLGRSKKDALEEYLAAVVSRSWREIFLWQVRDFSYSEADFQNWVASWTAKLTVYSISPSDQAMEENYFYVKLFWESPGGQEQLEEVFQVTLEQGVWKVNPPGTFLNKLTSTEENPYS